MNGTKFTEAFVGVVAAQVKQGLSGYRRERAWGGLVLGAPLAQRSSLTTISDVLVKSLVVQEAGDSMLRRSVSAALAVGSRRSHRGSGGNGGLGGKG